MKLTYKDVAMFYNCSLRTAQNRISEIRVALSIKKKYITIYDLSCYEGLRLMEVKEALNLS